MGAQGSRLLEQIQAQQRAQHPPPTPPPPAPAPMNSAQQCAVRRVEFNQLNNDLANKQQQIDTCDPQGAQARKTAAAVQANTDFVNQKRNELNQANADFTHQMTIANQVYTATEPLEEYLKTLKRDLEHLTNENISLERKERANRRRFLDNDPQQGVGGVPGIRTEDDRVLFAFWICYFTAVIGVCIVLTHIFEAQIGDWKRKTLLTSAVLMAAYGLAYYFIVFYG